MKKYICFGLLFITNFCQAEFNLADQEGRPNYIEYGYRNVLNSFFQRIPLDSNNINLKDYEFSIYTFDKNKKNRVDLQLKPTLKITKELKDKGYYSVNFNPYIELNNTKFSLPLILQNNQALGGSFIYNDSNISIFSLEYINYPNPSSSNKLLSFRSSVFILNKKNIGVYTPVFLDVNERIKDGNLVNKFSKFNSIKYNKVTGSYTVEFEIHKYPINEKGEVGYEKKPTFFNFIIKPTFNKNQNPFIIKNFIEKNKDSEKISTDNYNQLNQYYLNLMK